MKSTIAKWRQTFVLDNLLVLENLATPDMPFAMGVAQPTGN